jgi:hypothetical protein
MPRHLDHRNFKVIPRPDAPLNLHAGEALLCRDGFEGFESLPTGKILRARRGRHSDFMHGLGPLELQLQSPTKKKPCRSGRAVRHNLTAGRSGKDLSPEHDRNGRVGGHSFAGEIIIPGTSIPSSQRAFSVAVGAISLDGGSLDSGLDKSREGSSHRRGAEPSSQQSSAVENSQRQDLRAFHKRIMAENLTLKLTRKDRALKADDLTGLEEYDGEDEAELGETCEDEDTDEDTSEDTDQDTDEDGDNERNVSNDKGEDKAEVEENGRSEHDEDDACHSVREQEGSTDLCVSPKSIGGENRYVSVDLGESRTEDFTGKAQSELDGSLSQAKPDTGDGDGTGPVGSEPNESLGSRLEGSATGTSRYESDLKNPWATMDRLDDKAIKQTKRRIRFRRITGGEWFQRDVSRFRICKRMHLD